MIKSGKSKLISLLCLVFAVATFIISCQTRQPDKTSLSTTNSACVQNYNENLDYFPNKISITQAKGFTVEYHKNYKIITVKQPWKDAKAGFKYILVQCGTPAPQAPKDSQVITVPVNSVISLSTTHLPHIAKLEVVDKLIGVSDTKRVNTQEVAEKIKSGKIASVGSNSNVNVEKILELNPELITTYGTGNAQQDSYPKLLESGLKVAINAEYMENTPLGRSEWLKFTALFFNQEQKAEQIFSEVVKKYESVAKLAKSIKQRPTVFVGFNFKGTWYLPGGGSYAAKYLEDAGANYLWRDEKSSGSLPLSFEVVLERATNADFWVNLSQSWKTVKDLLKEDNRYGDFKAVKNNKLYNNNARVNENGGNDYWEGGISNPDVVLSDLIKIFHPEILPNHQLVYYRKIN
ncbi:MAG: ABC transporter substrate-binding protein [Scytonematopsis contorta HA4267-MV1]|jgi:iron complex transport system substrate-binding protein|nr:ABC transporter substrate-binding protein [Scytonematopsis contorta HA4267-MV1]